MFLFRNISNWAKYSGFIANSTLVPFPRKCRWNTGIHNRASKMTDSKRCGTKQFQNAPFDHGNTWFFMPEGDYTHNFGGGSKQAYGTKMTNKQIVARVSCWYRVYTRVSERTLIVIGRTLKANTIALKTVCCFAFFFENNFANFTSNKTNVMGRYIKLLLLSFCFNGSLNL